MIRPEDFFTFSQSIYNSLPSNKDSIELRTCVSRAYYYVFHHLRNRFNNHPKANFSKYAKEEQHREVVNFFYNLKHDDIAKRVANFNRARNEADYDLEKDLKKEDAQKWIHEAKVIVGRASKISPT